MVSQPDTHAMLQKGPPPESERDFPLGLIRPVPRIGTWLCALLLAFLSLAPADWLLRSDEVFDESLPLLEHALAYFLTAIVVAIGYGPRYRKAQLVLPVIAYAAILEAGQYLTPDRSPGLAELSAGALGAFCGVAIGEKISAWLDRRARAA